MSDRQSIPVSHTSGSGSLNLHRSSALRFASRYATQGTAPRASAATHKLLDVTVLCLRYLLVVAVYLDAAEVVQQVHQFQLATLALVPAVCTAHPNLPEYSNRPHASRGWLIVPRA
jgi:hypothetical protein